MSGQGLVALAGVLVSLAFEYVPGLNGWFERLQGDQKRAVMAAVLFVIAAGVFGLGCAGIGVSAEPPFVFDIANDFSAYPPPDGTGAVCGRDSALELFNAFVVALVLAGGGNQATYLLLPKNAKVYD